MLLVQDILVSFEVIKIGGQKSPRKDFYTFLSILYIIYKNTRLMLDTNFEFENCVVQISVFSHKRLCKNIYSNPYIL